MDNKELVPVRVKIKKQEQEKAIPIEENKDYQPLPIPRRWINY